MSLIWTLTLILAGLVLGVLGYCTMVLRKLGTPTTGAPIDLKGRPNSALVVIDVQEDFTRNTGKQAFDGAVRETFLNCVNKVIQTARQAGDDVIYIRNVFKDWPVIVAMKVSASGIGTPGRKGLRLDRDLDTGDEPTVFEKTIGDTFSSPAFEAWLADRKIGRLTLVGLDACHCVQLTAKGALSRGYEVRVHEPGLLTSTPRKWAEVKTDLVNSGATVTAA